MRKFRIIALIAIVVILFGLVGSGAAQLGDTDKPSLTVQNIDSTDASVTISFVDEQENGTLPTVLNNDKSNPFTLPPGESSEVYIPNIPLGDTENSSFTIQNFDNTDASVTITFVDEQGNKTSPTILNSGKSNPFTLTPGESWEVYVPDIPSNQLPNGRYSVVIAPTAGVVGIANLVGKGSINSNGSYSGFDSGGTTFYLPATVYNYSGWYSFI